MTTAEELKPCPFCGCKKITLDILFPDVWAARCTKCGATNPDGHLHKYAAIEAWNRRVSE